MYTSSDDADDGYYDNYISRGLCGTGPVNQQDFTIQDAVNRGLSPKYKSKGHCWICPWDGLYVPFDHPYRELIHDKLLTFANKFTHPNRINFHFFNYHRSKSMQSNHSIHRRNLTYLTWWERLSISLTHYL